MTTVADLVEVARKPCRGWWLYCPVCDHKELGWRGDRLRCLKPCGFEAKSASELVRYKEDSNVGRFG